jgi:predicted nucleic acid-binding protein
VNLVKRGTLKPLIDGVTLDLAVYESLNAVWKEHKVLGRIDLETAKELVELLKGVFDSVPLESAKGYEVEVFELASKEGLTAYDAAYLYIAMRDGLTLVSDDEELLSKASRYVKALRTTSVL